MQTNVILVSWFIIPFNSTLLLCNIVYVCVHSPTLCIVKCVFMHSKCSYV